MRRAKHIPVKLNHIFWVNRQIKASALLPKWLFAGLIAPFACTCIQQVV
ncbi:MAG: hypothetical protein HXY43_16740 [Fischerella sp.]|nr:hypothetical protein [Fischerella sp.]